MTKEFQYTVNGHWPFPTDMLRYDQSRAASNEDAELINRLSGEFAPDREAFKNVEITLVGPSKPATERWESFGWSVPSDQDHAYFKKIAQQRQEQERLFQGALAKLTPAEREVVMIRTRQH